METLKHIVVGNILGVVAVVGAAFGIVGGSLVICAACTVGLLLAGG